MKKHQTTIHLEEKDKEAIAAIKEHYGITSDVGAIRMALRELHRNVQQASPPITPQKERASYPSG